ncbi:MAG: hypothetical protein DRP86_04675 [Candidatus Neomarinimicrobiota bacterium]|nr:hypothetical protein [Candidatus Neomarinimicrobiota bacterium]RKY49783.1 MAG: hypothetical protein DRP86_04675 [Candidatus Neomarinimicrobiota bacterium]
MKHVKIGFLGLILVYSSLFSEEFLRVEGGAKWLMWFPDQPKRAEIKTKGYAGITLNARLNYKNIIRLYNLKYEFSNGIQAPTTKGRDELIKNKVGTTGYVLFHLLSDIFIPDAWNNLAIVFRTHYEDYRSTVHFTDDVKYIPYNFNEDPFIDYYSAGEEAEFYTRFSDAFLGISLGSPPGAEKFARGYFGGGKTLYQKPYTFHIGEQEIEDTITDTRFTGYFAGAGLVARYPLQSREALFFTLEYHVGSGEMELVKDRVDITRIADNNKSSINYRAMEMCMEYERILIPGKITMGMESNFKIKSFDLQTPSMTYEEAYNMNQDYFWGIKVNVGWVL